jgi:hypothetical protein
MSNLNPTRTPFEVATHAAQEMWAVMELLQRLGVPAQDQVPELGAAMNAAGTGLDLSKPYLALRIETQGRPKFAVNCGPLTVSKELFDEAWTKWILSVRGAASETPVERQHRERTMLEIFKTTDAWNERVGLQNYLAQMGVKFTPINDAEFGG